MLGEQVHLCLPSCKLEIANGKAKTMVVGALVQRLYGPAVCCPACRSQLSISPLATQSVQGKCTLRLGTDLLDDRPIVRDADVVLLNLLFTAVTRRRVTAEQAHRHAVPISLPHPTPGRQVLLGKKGARRHFPRRLRLPHRGRGDVARGVMR